MNTLDPNDMGGDEAKTTPLMAQFADDGDPGAPDDALSGMTGVDGSSRKGLNSGLIVLLGVVAIAVGTIVVMRRYGNGPGVSVADVQIDYQVGAGSEDDHTRVLADLQTIDESVQIPIDQVRPNPFEMIGEDDGEDTEQRASPSETEAERRQRLQRERMQRVVSAYEKLELHTVLSGKVPVARISGQTVRIGDSVGEHFTVVAIRDRSVDLRAEGRVFTLTMGAR